MEGEGGGYMNQDSLQLTGGNFNNNRRALDYYPTPRPVTIALMEFLQLPRCSKVWEPACGNGKMVEVLKTYVEEVRATDIIYGQDYLKTTGTADAIITNPPFNLSELFIKKAIEDAPLVAMLLKSQYWHALKRLKLFTTTKPSYVLPLTWRPDFLEHERMPGSKKGAPTMEVAWTVWVKGNPDKTVYLPLEKPLTNPQK